MEVDQQKRQGFAVGGCCQLLIIRSFIPCFCVGLISLLFLLRFLRFFDCSGYLPSVSDDSSGSVVIGQNGMRRDGFCAR